jgi:beta-lactam-binding protein with PASTA domain
MCLKKETIFNRPGLFTLCCAGVALFSIVMAASVFFMTVRGAEQTMVPEIRGKPLVDALLELQQKELYPRIELRYSGSAADKGQILEQDPRPGAIVKAGRRIRLVVSQGAVVNVVADYVGREVDDVRMELQTLFASTPNPLLTLKEPLLYQYSSKPAGTILEQSPAPGVSIYNPVDLEFVVSRGDEDPVVEMPALTGLGIADAIDAIGKSGIRFNFSMRPGQGRAVAETVIAQSPDAGAKMPANAVAEITVAAPSVSALGENEVFALFRHALPENPYPLPATLEALLPDGERRQLAALNHSGGVFSIPYRLPAGSVLILSMLNREMYRETVQPPRLD